MGFCQELKNFLTTGLRMGTIKKQSMFTNARFQLMGFTLQVTLVTRALLTTHSILFIL